MKLALIYDKNDHKLQATSYSWIYKGMLDALVNRFEEVSHWSDDCYAMDIDADLIMFFDVHATHHIRIDGIRSHPAVKMEYVSDPNQEEFVGIFRQFDRKVHKLGRRQRVGRFFERGLDYVVCPFKDGYYHWLGQYLGDDAEGMLLYFPLAPVKSESVVLYSERKPLILANGATRDEGKHIYDFRRWAFQQPTVTHIPHWIENKSTPSGQNYMKFLSEYGAALALHDYFPVPKYFEIPMAGCLTFAQHYPEYEALGFEDMKTCVYVKNNFMERTQDFLSNPDKYSEIAAAGRKLMEENYTADHFADFIYDKVKECRSPEQS